MVCPLRQRKKIFTHGTRPLATAEKMTKRLRQEGEPPFHYAPQLMPLISILYVVRQQDLACQLKADPISTIPLHLKRPSRAMPPPQSQSCSPLQQPQQPSPSSASHEGCLTRESVEWARALALLRRKQQEREHAESATAMPSTVHSGNNGLGYADIFNQHEVEDAHCGRDRLWHHCRLEDDSAELFGTTSQGA